MLETGPFGLIVSTVLVVYPVLQVKSEKNPRLGFWSCKCAWGVT